MGKTERLSRTPGCLFLLYNRKYGSSSTTCGIGSDLWRFSAWQLRGHPLLRRLIPRRYKPQSLSGVLRGVGPGDYAAFKDKGRGAVWSAARQSGKSKVQGNPPSAWLIRHFPCPLPARAASMLFSSFNIAVRVTALPHNYSPRQMFCKQLLTCFPFPRL